MLIPRPVFNLSKACDPSASRYALGGVQFSRSEAGNPVGVASDGRLLVAASWDEAPAGEYPKVACDPSPGPAAWAPIIPAAVCEKARKMAPVPKRCPKPILRNVVVDEHGEGKVHLAATNLESSESASTDTLDGKFPIWRDIFGYFHKGRQSVTVHVNPEYLLKVLSTMKAVLEDAANEFSSVALTIPTETRPIEGWQSCCTACLWLGEGEFEKCPKCGADVVPAVETASADGTPMLLSADCADRKVAALIVPLTGDRTHPIPLKPHWLPAEVASGPKPKLEEAPTATTEAPVQAGETPEPTADAAADAPAQAQEMDEEKPANALRSAEYTIEPEPKKAIRFHGRHNGDAFDVRIAIGETVPFDPSRPNVTGALVSVGKKMAGVKLADGSTKWPLHHVLAEAVAMSLVSKT
jgi:hypothetical protein